MKKKTEIKTEQMCANCIRHRVECCTVQTLGRGHTFLPETVCSDKLSPAARCCCHAVILFSFIIVLENHHLLI